MGSQRWLSLTVGSLLAVLMAWGWSMWAFPAAAADSPASCIEGVRAKIDAVRSNGLAYTPDADARKNPGSLRVQTGDKWEHDYRRTRDAVSESIDLVSDKPLPVTSE